MPQPKPKPKTKIKQVKVKKSTYVWLIFLLGTWGVHKFFINKTLHGIILLILFCIPFSVFLMEFIMILQNHDQSMLDYLINGLNKNPLPIFITYVLKLLYLINNIWVILDGIKAIKNKSDKKGYIYL